MLRTDYLMQQLERLTEALARMAARKDTQDYDAALTECDQACLNLSGMPVQTLLSMPIAAVLEALESPGANIAARSVLVARLLKERGEVLELSGDHGAARASMMRAFCLFDEIEKRCGEEAVEEQRETISWLVEKLS